MFPTVLGYYDGSRFVASENVAIKKGQRVIITILDEEIQMDASAPDADVDEISERLLQQNHEAYEVLAK